MKKTVDIKTKILNFLSKNSTYAIFGAVMLVVVIITSIGIFSTPSDDPTPSPSHIAEATPTYVAPTRRPTVTPSVTLRPTPENTPIIPGPSATLTPENTPTVNDPPSDGSQDVNGEVSKTFSIVLPFSKKSVINGYSNEKPVYSATLNEWACHVALDLKCNENDAVNCAANGIVISITEDSVYGKSVTVEHSEGFVTVYRGLKEVMVSKDELLSQGQALGTAASTIPFEEHMETHIHFELQKDGLCVDPLTFTK
ncbi:MAG: M23 family metallopeptidase [Clostridiales bacterium]|nr:M23 family metallopeptidase [Clostridiales bacterium]